MVVRMNNRELRKFVNSQPNDSKRHDALYDATKRIQQLEKLNATLAAEIDRMRPVVEAAQLWARMCYLEVDMVIIKENKLRDAVDDYEASQPK